MAGRYRAPQLLNTRPLWDGYMILLSLGGLAIGITGTVIGYRRLSNRLRA